MTYILATTWTLTIVLALSVGLWWNQPTPIISAANTCKVSDPLVEITPTYYKDTVTITWSTSTAPIPKGAHGLAVMSGDTCIIYAPEPQHLWDKDRMFILGAETLHCFRGLYHD